MCSLNNMVKSVVREHKWKPHEIDDLFFDDIDYHGLIYWYNDIKKVNNELKAKAPKTE